MSDPSETDSPLAAAAGSDTGRASDAFAALSNETRLAILLALWEAYEPAAPDDGLSFSALRERVGVRDSGQFNYHLDQLTGQFLRKDGEEYVLRRAGHELVRTIVAGAGIEEPALDHHETDLPCPNCGAPTEITYEDEWLFRVCTACEGSFAGTSTRPDGYLSGVALDPAGFADRTPEQLWATAMNRARSKFKSAVEGVCDECSGPMEAGYDVCDDHDPDGVCDACGRSFATIAVFWCPVCKNHHAAPPRSVVLHHPAVVAFYHERGVNVQYDVNDVERVRRRERLLADHEQELVGSDPARVRVTVSYEGDELRLLLDESVDVLAVETP